MTTPTLIEMAEDLQGTALEILDWSASRQNSGPYSREIHVANVQIAAALERFAERLRARASQGGE